MTWSVSSSSGWKPFASCVRPRKGEQPQGSCEEYPIGRRSLESRYAPTLGDFIFPLVEYWRLELIIISLGNLGDLKKILTFSTKVFSRETSEQNSEIKRDLEILAG